MMLRWWCSIILLALFVKVNYCLNEVLRATHPLYGLSTLAEEVDDNSSSCFKHFSHLQRAVDEEKVWAIKALDASGRPGSGFLYGNNLWLGSHFQCSDISNRKKLEIRHEKVKHLETPYDFPPFSMGFAMVIMRHNSTLQYHTRMPLEWTAELGLCVPQSCTKDDILLLSKSYFNGKYLEFQNVYHVNLEVIDIRPLREDTVWLFKQPKTIFFLVLLSVVLLLTIVGTIYDVKKHNREKNLIIGHNGKLNGYSDKNSVRGVSTTELVPTNPENNQLQTSTLGEVLKCFSFYSNTKSFVRTKLSSDSLTIIHGLRFLGMLWVVAVHGIFYQIDYIENIPTGFKISENAAAQIFSNSTYCVDTYLFMSGFLLAYLFYQNKNPHEETDKAVNYLRKCSQFLLMIVNRVLRLTPPYIVLLIFTDVMYTHYSQSSSLLSSEKPDVVCEKYWWRNLLYINNLYPRSEMCLSWSWYLSLDMQFFTITSFLLIISTITFKTSAIIVFLLILVNVVTTTYKSYSIGYIPTMDDQLVQLDAIYDLPWMRIGPYLVGVVTAYMLIIKMKMKLELKERTRKILWTLFPLLNLWILFTLYTRQVSVGFSAFYMGASRTLWAIGLAWLLVACCTRNARALEKFLSFRGWIPLSRLTYCAYLLNPLVVNMLSLSSESTVRASRSKFAVTVCGFTLITFFMAFVFSILFESPCILLTKMALKKITKERKAEGPQIEEPKTNVGVA